MSGSGSSSKAKLLGRYPEVVARLSRTGRSASQPRAHSMRAAEIIDQADGFLAFIRWAQVDMYAYNFLNGGVRSEKSLKFTGIQRRELGALEEKDLVEMLGNIPVLALGLALKLRRTTKIHQRVAGGSEISVNSLLKRRTRFSDIALLGS
ncbi:uncharacterized protein Z518_05085 [Rhinocladiella mackenziei CBS 650.93]|uniref:Uncharacterized protein n=1 Tax=Rhinocladiella mackenziei CBS 650.93 TaxID=1442369 RepID=A0A0D2H9E7_9EURO|nr:uncharacterized protein Z518_05085 [Rhinocladiella mackenziei CBS 650.93]KIX07108.1 hypothetical protein Z518_05085 [Rhinocladiella mackenziei CBS 650.93]